MYTRQRDWELVFFSIREDLDYVQRAIFHPQRRPEPFFGLPCGSFDTRCGKSLSLTPECAKVLRSPRRALTLSLPIKMDDGTIKVFSGISGTAQQCPRALQGRHPLSSQRHLRRSAGVGFVDDVESAPTVNIPFGGG